MTVAAHRRISPDLVVLEDHPAGLYRLYRSDALLSTHGTLIRECGMVHKKFEEAFPDTNSTSTTTPAEKIKYKNHAGYRLYNVFGIAAPSKAFFAVYRAFVNVIRDFASERELYAQAWLNYQSADEVLGWHTHEGSLYHGYISIDPQDTRTEFEDHYEIQNRPGQIYITRACLRHRVVNLSSYSKTRITIGFDITDPQDKIIASRGLIPMLL